MTPSATHADPSRGVFETLLVLAGEPLELDAHLGRLGASLAALYGAALPATVAALARERAAGVGHGRLRLTARPAPAGVELQAEVAETDPAPTFPPPDEGAALFSLSLAGGLGAHKWVDRSALGEERPGVVPLLLDGEEVLEAGWGNVFAVIDGVLTTPPLDRRLLPGVTRALALAAGRDHGLPVRERPILRAELDSAAEVLVTNAVRGIEAPRSLDGSALPGPGQVSALLTSALRARWYPRVPVG